MSTSTDIRIRHQEVVALAHYVMDRFDITASEAVGMCDSMVTMTKAQLVEQAGLPRRLNLNDKLWSLVRGHLVSHLEQTEVRMDEVRPGDLWLNGDTITAVETSDGRTVATYQTCSFKSTLTLLASSKVWVVRR